MKKIRILIADDHTLLRIGLKTLCECQNDMTVVGEACDGEEAVARAVELKPDVVLMDLMMPKMNGAEATRLIRETSPETEIVLLTSYADSGDLVRAVKNGAKGAEFKGSPTTGLLQAIRSVAAGQTAYSSEIEKILSVPPPLPKLSERQQEVLDAMTRGLTNDDIAKMLGISRPRVKQLAYSVYAKLGAANRSEAIAIAMRLGMAR